MGDNGSIMGGWGEKRHPRRPHPHHGLPDPPTPDTWRPAVAAVCPAALQDDGLCAVLTVCQLSSRLPPAYLSALAVK
jgi:hypothetical protein